MPQQLTKEQLNNYRKIIENGGVNGAIQVYSELLTKGYNYAGWAKGVAGADTLTGNSALAYLEGSALLGINGNGSSNISVQQATNIKVGMGFGYIDTLIDISNDRTLSSFDVVNPTGCDVISFAAKAEPALPFTKASRTFFSTVSVFGVGELLPLGASPFVALLATAAGDVVCDLEPNLITSLANAFPKASAAILPQSFDLRLPPPCVKWVSDAATVEPQKFFVRLAANPSLTPPKASSIPLPVLPVIPEETDAIAISVQLNWVSKPAILLLA
jgi:hypothetical protein